MSNHEQLVGNAERAISQLFGDKSVSLDRTMEDLKDLQSGIDSMIEALQSDVKKSGLES